VTDEQITGWLAEKVMGWKHHRGNIWRSTDDGLRVVGPTGFEPLTSISDAMECLDRWIVTTKEKEVIAIEADSDGWNIVRSYQHESGGFTQDQLEAAALSNVPRAICLALVKATGSAE